MSDEVRETSDESPRPWSIDDTRQGPYILDANGGIVAWLLGDNSAIDAELIVRAVNGRGDLLKAREMLQAECRGLAAEADHYFDDWKDAEARAERMADLVRRLCDMVADHPIWRPSEMEQWLLAEARKAIGEVNNG